MPTGSALVDQYACVLDLLSGTPDLPAKPHTQALRSFHSSAGAL